jgi:hypothetical protein
MSNKIKLLLTKKEFELAQGSSPETIRTHTPHRLKQYVKLVRKLRDKYRDLTQRQRAALKKSPRNSQSLRTIEKSRIFSKVLAAFEQQSKKVELKSKAGLKIKSQSPQKQLDQERHYDIDGVTRVNGNVVIPSGIEVNKESYDLLAEPSTERD